MVGGVRDGGRKDSRRQGEDRIDGSSSLRNFDVYSLSTDADGFNGATLAPAREGISQDQLKRESRRYRGRLYRLSCLRAGAESFAGLETLRCNCLSAVFVFASSWTLYTRTPMDKTGDGG